MVVPQPSGVSPVTGSASGAVLDALARIPIICFLATSEEMRIGLPQMASGIAQVFNEATESAVRQAAITALLALDRRVGREALLPHLSCLNPVGICLLDIFTERGALASSSSTF